MESTIFGGDLTQVEGDHLVLLTKAEQHELQCLLDQTLVNPYEDIEQFILQAKLIFHELPKRIRRRLVEFQKSGNLQGAVLVRGLPVDPALPMTPSDSRRCPSKITWASELWSTVFSTPFGDLISYAQEKDGEIFQNICPTPKNAKMLSSESSSTLLDFHTEVAFHPFMPDYLSLYCLRQDHDRVARTLVAGVRKIDPLLTPSQRLVLQQPVFETGIDFSFGSPNAKQGGGLVCPVFYGDNSDPYIRFDPDLMIGKTDEASEIIRILKSIVNQVADYVLLEPGDLLIVDNRRAVHARTEFTARYDGKDRWLQRTCIVRSLVDSAVDRRHGERIIRTEFAV
jgi:hypothetical protein